MRKFNVRRRTSTDGMYSTSMPLFSFRASQSSQVLRRPLARIPSHPLQIAVDRRRKSVGPSTLFALLSAPDVNSSATTHYNPTPVPVQSSNLQGSRALGLGKSKLLGPVRTLLKVWVCSLGAPSSESTSALVKLHSGDRVWLRTMNIAHGVRGELQTTFAGHLLDALYH